MKNCQTSKITNMKTRVKTLTDIDGIEVGSLGVVDGYTGTQNDDFAIVIIGKRILTINIKYLEFVEFFNPLEKKYIGGPR